MAINVGTAMAFLELDTSKFTTGLASAGADLRDFATNGNVQSLGNAMNGIGSDLTKGVTLPVAGAGAAIVKVAADYEQQLSKIKAVSGGTAEEMKQLDDLALKMGKDTSFSAKEAAQGIEELSKAGLTNEQILNGGLKGALSLASAGDLELADAASIASDALNTFKADALSVGDAANILAGAANASSTDVGELKYGMSAAGSVAAGMGMNFKDTATALAVFANNGLKGSDAGTSLKTMLMNLQPSTNAQYATFERLGLMTYDTTKAYEYLVKEGITPASNSFADVDKAMRKHAAEEAGAKEGTKKADKAYRELTNQLGVLHSKFYDNNGNMKSLAEVTEILKESTTGLTNAQRAQVLETMFGSDAIRGANILFKEGAKGINDMQAAMGKVTADEVAATKLDNFKGSLEQFMGSIETLAIVLGKLLLPYLKQMVDWLTGILNKFLELPEPVQKNIMAMLGIAAAVGPLLIIFSKVVGAVGTVINAFKTLSSIGSILSALPALMNPYVFIIVGIIAAIAAAVYLIYKNWDALSSYFSNLWEWIKKIFSEFWEWMKAFFAEWGPTILAIMFPFLAIPIKIWEHWGQIKVWFTELYNHIASICDSIGKWFSDAIDKWIGIWDGFTNFMSGIGSSMWEGLIDGLVGGWDWVFDKIKSLADGVKNIFKKVLDINSPSRVFRSYGKYINEGLIIGIEDNSHEVKSKIGQLGEVIIDTFKNKLDIHSPSRVFSELGGFIVDGVNQGMMEKSDVAANVISGIGNDMIEQAENLEVGNLAHMMKDKIAKQSVGTWSEKLFDLPNVDIPGMSDSEFTKMSQKIQVINALQHAYAILKNIINSVGVALLSLVAGYEVALTGASKFTDSLLSVVKWVKDSLDHLMQYFRTFYSFLSWVVDGMVNEMIKFKNFMSEVFDKIINLLDYVASKFKDLFISIKNGFSALGDFITSLLNDLSNSIVGKAFNVGVNIVEGIISGLLSATIKLGSVIIGIGQGIIKIIDIVFDIHSPSRVMAQRGKYISEGLAMGITDNEHLVTNETTNTANKITKGFENAINSDAISGLVSSYGGEVVSSIAGVMNDNFPVISSNINKISSYINGALDNLPIPAASILSNALGSIGSNLKEMSINWASNKIEMLSNSGVMTSVTDKFKLYTNAMNVSSAASKIATITTNALSIATSVFSTVMTVLTGPVGLVVLAITGLTAASYLLWSNWDSIGPKLKAIWEDISNFAINVFSGLGSIFNGFGTNIMDGLLSGLVSGIEGIKNCVESIGDAIKNTFKRLLGINSPSKIFHEYGGFIGEGLVNGLDAQDSTITSKFGTLGNKIKNIGNVKPNFDLTNATGNLGKLTELSNLEIHGNYKPTPHENYAPKQFSFNPEIVMHVSVADTGAKGTAQLTNELKSMTKSSLKNGLVDSFLNDAFRL